MDHLQFINKMIIFIQLEGNFFCCFFDLTCSQNKKGSIFIENKHPFFPCLQTGVLSLHTQRNALVTGNWNRVYVCMYVYIYISKRMDWCGCEGISRAGHLRQTSVPCQALSVAVGLSLSPAELITTFCHLPQPNFSPLASQSRQSCSHLAAPPASPAQSRKEPFWGFAFLLCCP